MHPKNPFQSGYDFNSLIKHHAILREFVFINPYGKKSINFAEPLAVKALNTALLKQQYNIDWDIPDSNLCPPIPGRLDYLLYVADLVAKPTVRLFDIGTGANLIYPILSTCHFKWQCTGSEVNFDSIKHARTIIDKNKKLQSIELRPSNNKVQYFNERDSIGRSV